MSWLPHVRPVGLGCMRLSTDPHRDEGRARATLTEAILAGVNVLDTAPSYGQAEDDAHHSERLVASVLEQLGPRAADVKVVTKAGIHRVGTAWVTDGRRKSLRASCDASRAALGGRPIDLLLLHAPDPRTPIETSARALRALVDEGAVRAAGLSNVNLSMLDAAQRVLEVQAVEVSLGAFDDAALRSGLVAHCRERRIPVLAHSPLGGPKRASRLERDPVLTGLGRKHGVTAGTIVLAWLYSHGVIPIPGATRPDTAKLAARASLVALDEEDQAALRGRFPEGIRATRTARSVSVERQAGSAEIVLVMGIQAGGKSTFVERYVRDGYERLNRDERGGTLRALHAILDERLAAGGRRFVLDNTYPTRASRAEIVSIATRHGAEVRLVHLDTPIEIAQTRAISRLLARYGRLPDPEELRVLARKDANTFGPNVLYRFRRELERPGEDEGFASIEVARSERHEQASESCAGGAFAAEMAIAPSGSPLRAALDAFLLHHHGQPTLAFGFAAGALGERLRAAVLAVAAHAAPITVALCAHGGGPPVCWCRPPLPGLVLVWMREHRIDPRKVAILGAGTVHLAIARSIGARYVDAAASREPEPQ